MRWILLVVFGCKLDLGQCEWHQDFITFAVRVTKLSLA